MARKQEEERTDKPLMTRRPPLASFNILLSPTRVPAWEPSLDRVQLWEMPDIQTVEDHGLEMGWEISVSLCLLVL